MGVLVDQSNFTPFILIVSNWMVDEYL